MSKSTRGWALRKALRKLGQWLPVSSPIPRYAKAATNPATCIEQTGASDWYPPVLLSAAALGECASASHTLERVIGVLEKLEPDDYIRYLLRFYRGGLTRYGEGWRYADITTVLTAAAELVRPRRYLEIGVRRGRSLAMVTEACPDVHIVGVDLWLPDYAGMPNPGPDFVHAEIIRTGHRGRLELLTGSSHRMLPRYFKAHPDTFFDLITVDGDHSSRGASIDLALALPRLTVGGAIVFDDIAHPTHPNLAGVWQRYVASQDRFSSWSYAEIGYGVGVGIRKY